MPVKYLEPIVLQEDLPQEDIEAAGAVKYAYFQRICHRMDKNKDFNYYDGEGYNSRPLSYTEVLVCLYNNLNEIQKKLARKENSENSDSNKTLSQLLVPYFGDNSEKPAVNLENLIKLVAQKEYPDLPISKNIYGNFAINSLNLGAPCDINKDEIVSAEEILRDHKVSSNTLRELINEAIKPAITLFEAFDERYQWTAQKKNVSEKFWYIQNSIKQIKTMNQNRKQIWEKHPFEEDVMQIRRAVELLASPTLSMKSRKEIETRMANILTRYGCTIRRREIPIYAEELERQKLLSAQQALKSIADLKEEGLLEDYKISYSKICRTEDEFKKFSEKILLALKDFEEKSLQTDTRKNVLRDTFSGVIENPHEELLSHSLIVAKDSAHLRKSTGVDYKSVLGACKVWEICRNNPTFKSIENYLTAGLESVKFPPEEINNLTYPDIAWLINKGGRFASLNCVNNMIAQNSSRVNDAIQLPECGRAKANQDFATNYEKQLMTAIKNYEVVYENPDIGVFINVKHSESEIENIVNEIKMGRSGLNASLPDFYESIYKQIIYPQKDLLADDNETPEEKEKIYKSAVSNILNEKFTNNGFDKEKTKDEIENIINNLRFQFDGHHGEEISKISFHNNETNFDFNTLNNPDNIYQTLPQIHNAILHAFDNIDYNRQTYVKGYSKHTGIVIFNNPSSKKYWQYEIVPAEHVRAYTGKSSLIVDDEFYNNCKKFIFDYRKQNIKETIRSKETSIPNGEVSGNIPEIKKTVINKRHSPERRMLYHNKRDIIEK